MNVWLKALKDVGRWPGAWIANPGDWKLQPMDDETRRAEAIKRGALNPDGSPCTTFWCAAGFDHPLGCPFYELPGDPRHNAYCVQHAEEAFEGEAGEPPAIGPASASRVPW